MCKKETFDVSLNKTKQKKKKIEFLDFPGVHDILMERCSSELDIYFLSTLEVCRIYS